MGDRVFFVSGFWAKNPVEVGRDPFPPYTSEMGHLHPKVMLFSTPCFIFPYHTSLIFFSFAAVRRPALSKFYLDRVQ